MTRWEYRTATIHEDTPTCTDDDDLGKRLTNLARPGTHEHGYADDWEIFAVRGIPDGRARLYMKRPAAVPPQN